MNNDNLRFVRKYRITIIDQNNIALDVSDLRCTFRVEYLGYQYQNFAEISIYNLSSKTQVDIIKSGLRLVLEAGYKNGQFGKIFDGNIYQPIWDRENIVDYKLTLLCFDGDSQLNLNFVNMAVQVNHDSRNDLLAIMKNARYPFENGGITENIDTTEMPRGKVYFGMPKKYFREIANANNAQWSYTNGKLIVSNLTNIPQTEALVISPDNGLIGTPQQTQDGVELKTLLNPALRVQYPPMQIKLDNSIVRQAKLQFGQLQTRLDQDGFYYVASVVHYGDTRGDEWYTDIVGFNSTGSGLVSLYNNNRQFLN